LCFANQLVFDINFTFTWWSFGVPDKLALGLSSFLVFIDFINEFGFQMFFKFGVPYILGYFIPADEKRLIALYNSLDVDGDKNLSQEELQKGMVRLQSISQMEARRGKGNEAATMLTMAKYLNYAFNSLIKLDKLDDNTKSSSGFTLTTLLKAYRASKRRHQKRGNEPKAAVEGEIDFDKLETALDAVAHKQLAFKIDNSPDKTEGSKDKMDEMKLGMRIHGLTVSEVLPNSQCELAGVAVGDAIIKISQGKTVIFSLDQDLKGLTAEAKAWAEVETKAIKNPSAEAETEAIKNPSAEAETKAEKHAKRLNAQEARVTELLIKAHKEKENIIILLDTSARALSTFGKGKQQLSKLHGSFKTAIQGKVDDKIKKVNEEVEEATGLSALNGANNPGADDSDAAKAGADESDAAKAALGTMIKYETYFFKGDALKHVSPIDTLNAVAGNALAMGHQVTWKSKTSRPGEEPDYMYGAIIKVQDGPRDYWRFEVYEKTFVETTLQGKMDYLEQVVKWDEMAKAEQKEMEAKQQENPDEGAVSEATDSELTTLMKARENSKAGTEHTYETEELTGGWAKPVNEAETKPKPLTKVVTQEEKDLALANKHWTEKFISNHFKWTLSALNFLGTAYVNSLQSAKKRLDQFVTFADRLVTLGKISTFAVAYVCYTTALLAYLLPTFVTFPSVIFVFVVTAWVWFSFYIGFIVILTLTTLLLMKRSPHLAQQWLSKEWWKWFRLPELAPLIPPHHLKTLFDKCIYYTAATDIEVEGW
jgi:hypothetical protein